jgi:hypothetical protein
LLFFLKKYVFSEASHPTSTMNRLEGAEADPFVAEVMDGDISSDPFVAEDISSDPFAADSDGTEPFVEEEEEETPRQRAYSKLEKQVGRIALFVTTIRISSGDENMLTYTSGCRRGAAKIEDLISAMTKLNEVLSDHFVDGWGRPYEECLSQAIDACNASLDDLRLSILRLDDNLVSICSTKRCNIDCFVKCATYLNLIK